MCDNPPSQYLSESTSFTSSWKPVDLLADYASSPSQMEKYQYQPLSSSEEEIRLVLLHPRQPSRPEEIRLTIFKTPLSADRRLWPDFMALSYVWGDASKRRELLVVEAEDALCPPNPATTKRLSVTANLAEALQYFPWPDKHKIIWIDAICINQEDLVERAEQIKFMPRIYSSAGTVIAWLGAPTHDNNLAMTLLHRISESVHVDRESHEIYRKESEWTTEKGPMFFYYQLFLDPNFPLPWDGPESQALESLFNRPWFERLWIRQEICLGGKRGVLLCGNSSIEWSAFENAAIFLDIKIKDNGHPQLEQWRNRTALVVEVGRQNMSWLGEMMRQMQRTSCTDPRDRVYGILGILPTGMLGMTEKIHPDYKKSVVQVYQEFLLAEITGVARTDLLSECLMPAHPTSTWSPSWVPNWSIKKESTITTMNQCADAQSAVDASLIDDKTLQITGVITATITDVIQIPPFIRRGEPTQEVVIPEAPPKLPPIIVFVKEIGSRFDLSAAEHPFRLGRSSAFDALCYAFSGGGHLKDHVSEEMSSDFLPSLAQFKRFFRFALDYNQDGRSEHDLDADVKSQMLTCMSHMEKACRERALIITAEGYIGLGPVSTQLGDRIAVALGCMRPLVLRPDRHSEGPAAPKEIKNDNHKYNVVGTCHSHGLNWGEALLGPLPGGVTLIWNHSGHFGDVSPAFRVHILDVDTVLDPRVDWKLLKTNNRELAFMSGPDEAGDWMLCRRPDAEYFKRKGISLVNIKLM